MLPVSVEVSGCLYCRLCKLVMLPVVESRAVATEGSEGEAHSEVGLGGLFVLRAELPFVTPEQATENAHDLLRGQVAELTRENRELHDLIAGLNRLVEKLTSERDALNDALLRGTR